MSRSATASPRPVPVLPPGAPRARITVLSENAGPARMTDEPVLLIGGRRDCQIPLVHGDVSQVHAAIVNTGSTLIVADLASRTGTFVNDERIVLRALGAGDRVRIAGLQVKVEWLYATGPSNPAAAHLKTPLRLVLKNGTKSLTTLPAVIGRRQSCAVVVDTPDVSLAHALLLAIDNRPAILDLGSRSGTFLNGQRIQFSWLHDRDKLFVGGEACSVHWAGAVGGSATSASASISEEHHAPLETIAAAEPEPPTATAMTVAAMPAPPLAEADAAARALISSIESQWLSLRETLDRECGMLQTRERELAQRASEIAQSMQALRDERDALSTLAASLQEQSRALLARERELTQREQDFAEKARQIEVFRAALSETSLKLNAAESAAKTEQGATLTSESPRLRVDRPLFGALPTAGANAGLAAVN